MGKAIVAADNITLIATLNERRCGFASMHFGHNEAHLNLLAVEPQYRRQGIARGLLAWLDESCVVAGITTIALEVRASNITAIRFYEALGYNQTACINNYYCGREAAVRMARSISHAQEFVFNRDAER